MTEVNLSPSRGPPRSRREYGQDKMMYRYAQTRTEAVAGSRTRISHQTRWRIASLLVGALFAAAPGLSVAAADVGEPTDVNLITAIDVSDSITRHEEWLQYEGLARAIANPDFLQLVQSGTLGRVGFMAFTWSSDGSVRVVVPWTQVTSQNDALRTARTLRQAPRIDRSHYAMGPDEQDSVDTTAVSDARTDIALAIAFATNAAVLAPFDATRTIVNICSNGVDNAGEPPRAARDAALRSGITINGVVFGAQRDLRPYFETSVTGGPGSFVMEVRAPDDLPDALERKFWRDMIVALAARAAA